MDRRRFLFSSVALATIIVIPSPAYALSTDPVENLIARTLGKAAARTSMSSTNATNIATKLGVRLGQVAPRSTPWLKVLAKASPVGRIITVVGALWMAYDAIGDKFTIAPQQGRSGETWDGNNPRCELNQVCTFKEANGTPYTVFTTLEIGSSASSWSYHGKYSAIKNISLGAAAAPYKYQVWWKAPYGDTPSIRDPLPASESDPKVSIAPGNLADYLAQFAEGQPDPVGMAQMINDALADTEAAGLLSPNSIRVTGADVAAAQQVGTSTKIGDFTRDTAYDRDPQLVIDPTTGTDTGTITDPDGTVTNPTGPGTGTNQCLPGSADCPAEVVWGDAPTVPDLADVTPNPFTPTPQTLNALPTGECPTIDFTFLSKNVVVDGHCAALESKRSLIWTLGNATGILGAFRILMSS